MQYLRAYATKLSYTSDGYKVRLKNQAESYTEY